MKSADTQELSVVLLIVLGAVIYGVGSFVLLATGGRSWFVLAEPLLLALLLAVPLWGLLHSLDWLAATSSRHPRAPNPVASLLLAVDLAGIAFFWIAPHRL